MSGVHPHGLVHAHPPRLHPRGALLLTLCFLLLVGSLRTLQPGSFLWLFGLTHLCALRLSVSLRDLWKHSLWVLPLSLCALPQGPAGWTLVAMRSLLCVQAGLLLSWSLTAPVLLDTLYWSGVPSRLVAVLRFAVRYLEVFHTETQRLNRARELRQLRPIALRASWRAIGQVVGSLFVRTLDRSERIFQAMRSRGYRGQLPPPRPLRAWNAADTMILLHGMAALGLALCWR